MLQISWRLVIRNPIKITPILHPWVGSLYNWVVGYGHLDGTETPRRSCVSTFIKVGHQEPRQDDPCPPSWSWILEQLGGWGWPSWWVRNTTEKLCFKFDQDWSLGTLSRWPPILHPGIGFSVVGCTLIPKILKPSTIYMISRTILNHVRCSWLFSAQHIQPLDFISRLSMCTVLPYPTLYRYAIYRI